MEVRAQLNGVRLAPRKVRAVVDLIKKKDVTVALNQLDHLVKKPTSNLSKLIRSAVASAKNMYRMVPENLYIKDLFVNEGVKLKRYLPRAQGRATEIQKKTSRITLVLDERVAGLKQAEQKTKEKEAEQEHKRDHVEEPKKSDKPEVERKIGKKSGLIERGKRFFSRKSI